MVNCIHYYKCLYVAIDKKNCEGCKRYTKASIDEKVNTFEKVITSDLFDEIIDDT